MICLKLSFYLLLLLFISIYICVLNNKKYFLILYTVFVNVNINTSRYKIQSIIIRRLIYLKSHNRNSIIFMDGNTNYYRGLKIVSIPKYIILYTYKQKKYVWYTIIWFFNDKSVQII